MVVHGTPVIREMKANIPQKCHYTLKGPLLLLLLLLFLFLLTSYKTVLSFI